MSEASELVIWGLVAHLVADWLFQNEWMAVNKANLKHPAGYVHAGIHGIALAFVFGWVAVPLAVSHLLIDTRKPVAWWSRLIRQTQPQADALGLDPRVMDIGADVRIWADQVWHISLIAIAALLVSA